MTEEIVKIYLNISLYLPVNKFIGIQVSLKCNSAQTDSNTSSSSLEMTWFYFVCLQTVNIELSKRSRVISGNFGHQVISDSGHVRFIF